MSRASRSVPCDRDREPYPGTGTSAGKGEYDSFHAALKSIKVKVRHDRYTLGRFSPTAGVTLPAANPDLGTLADEFLHAWNHHHGRGKYLEAEAAELHCKVYDMAVETFRKTGKGTSGLPDGWERTFHQLEALNYLSSPLHKPRFLARIEDDLLRWALNWKRDRPGG
jgi:hypothetical protein